MSKTQQISYLEKYEWWGAAVQIFTQVTQPKKLHSIRNEIESDLCKKKKVTQLCNLKKLHKLHITQVTQRYMY